jgi:hypothetical protein
LPFFRPVAHLSHRPSSCRFLPRTAGIPAVPRLYLAMGRTSSLMSSYKNSELAPATLASSFSSLCAAALFPLALLLASLQPSSSSCEAAASL